MKRADSGDRRRYEDACAAAHGMDLIGDRWAMPVMRELLLGPRRFTDIKTTLTGISANVLTQRLEQLDAAGIVRKRKLPPPASVQVYELTQWGHEAAPIFQAMGRWAVRSPKHDPSLTFSPVSLMLSLRTMFSDAAAGDWAARLQFDIGEESFFWIRKDRVVQIGRGAIEDPHAVLTGTTSAIAAIVYSDIPLEDVIARGDLGVEGDTEMVRSLGRFFPMPDKAVG